MGLASCQKHSLAWQFCYSLRGYGYPTLVITNTPNIKPFQGGAKIIVRVAEGLDNFNPALIYCRGLLSSLSIS